MINWIDSQGRVVAHKQDQLPLGLLPLHFPFFTKVHSSDCQEISDNRYSPRPPKGKSFFDDGVITITVIGANWHHYYILFGKWPPWLFFVRQLIRNVEALSAVATVTLNINNFITIILLLLLLFAWISGKYDPNLSAVKGSALFSLPLFETPSRYTEPLISHLSSPLTD